MTMSTPLFDPHLVYPSDHEGGRYVEFTGPVVKVGTFDAGNSQLLEISLTVRTDWGEFKGCWRTPRSSTFKPQTGMEATIRVYDSGGGWYPGHRIVSIDEVQRSSRA